MNPAIGAHVSPGDPLGEASERGADLVQIFLSNPQSWKAPKPREDAETLRSSAVPIYVHAPYLINLVAENNRVRIPSRKILQNTCDAAAAIGAAGVVVHGGHVTGSDDMAEAYPRWRKALEQLDSEVPVLIENTAGGDNAVVRTVEGLRRLWDVIGDLGPGLVLDTCHAWAGGEPLDGIVERIVEIAGKIDLVHCNDSRDGFGSRRDRHANLDEGEIGLGPLAGVVAAAAAPVVLETPGDAAVHRRDIARLREAVAGS